jgi:hypothetical protein
MGRTGIVSYCERASLLWDGSDDGMELLESGEYLRG